MDKLSEVEREDLRIQHKQTRDKRICDRIKAVLLHDEGWSLKDIAHVLLISDEAVRQHVCDYQESKKLKPENGGSVSKLNADQTQALLKHLQEHTYLYTKHIIEYVEVTYFVKYTVPGMTSWLKSHNFSYKKPAVVPGKASPEAQQKWISEYETLKANLSTNEAICFMDGVHPTHNTKITYGWIKKGERKEIRTNTGRQRLNLSGLIDIHTKKVCIQENKTLNSTSTIEFLKKVENAYPTKEKIHIFCDNARYYRNKDVKIYLEQSKIQLHFLPPYSPNLNPIERLWKFVNQQILYNTYYETFSEFKKSILGFFEKLSTPCSNVYEMLTTRITDNFRVVVAAFSNSSF
jgi:transposase